MTHPMQWLLSKDEVQQALRDVADTKAGVSWERLKRHLEALTAPRPDEVARDADDLLKALRSALNENDGLALAEEMLARLQGWATRAALMGDGAVAMGSLLNAREAEVTARAKDASVNRRRAEAAEAERDESRARVKGLEAEYAQQEGRIKGLSERLHSAESERDALREKLNEALAVCRGEDVDSESIEEVARILSR